MASSSTTCRRSCAAGATTVPRGAARRLRIQTEPAGVVRRFYDALNARDFAAARSALAERCEWTSMASGARELGPAPLLKGLLDFAEAFPDVRFEVLWLHATGAVVVVEWRTTGTHLGVFRGHEPTRRRVTRRGCAVHEVEEGRIVRVRDYYDRRTFDEQLRP